MRDDSVRHGRGQGGRALRDPPLAAQVRGGLLPGGGPRRPRRGARRLPALLPLPGRQAHPEAHRL